MKSLPEPKKGGLTHGNDRNAKTGRRPHGDGRRTPYDREYMGGEQIVVTENEKYRWVAICTPDSYGWQDGLLEVMGKPLLGHGGVMGYRTAEDVLKMLKGERSSCQTMRITYGTKSMESARHVGMQRLLPAEYCAMSVLKNSVKRTESGARTKTGHK